MISLQIDDEFAPIINASTLADVAEATLVHQAVITGEKQISQPLLTVVLTDDESVRELNRTFRLIDAPTDVLSFPNQDFPAADPVTEEHALEPTQSTTTLILPEEVLSDDAAYLGDIIIAVPYTQRQAEREKRTLASELELLVVHGVLHLLGYDHGTVEEERAMWAIQDEVLAKVRAGGDPDLG